MRIRSSVAALAVLAAFLVVPSMQAQKAPKRQRDLVTRDELMEAQSQANMYDALRSVRPRFLEPPPGVRSLGNAKIIPTAVVLDGKVLGGLDVLQTIMASTVDEARYYDPAKAGTEFGNAAGGGAVVIKTFRPRSNPKVIVKDDTTATKIPR